MSQEDIFKIIKDSKIPLKAMQIYAKLKSKITIQTFYQNLKKVEKDISINTALIIEDPTILSNDYSPKSRKSLKVYWYAPYSKKKYETLGRPKTDIIDKLLLK